MKTAILFISLLFASTGAFAQTVDTNSGADASSDAGAASNSGAAIEFNAGGDSKRQAPGLGLGSIGTSFASDYCSGAVQGGISIPGGSAAFGKSVNDAGCNKRRNIERTMQIAGTYQSLGDVRTAGSLRQGAVNIMCGSDIETYNALVLAGVNCQMLPGGYTVKQDEKGQTRK